MDKITTPHITAVKNDFAATVIMPGDPLRARYIAEKYLKDTITISGIRGIHLHTGTFAGKRVSVMASGMGMPSIGIYSYELFHYFGVQNIIRVGSAGAIAEGLKIGDIVIALSASTNSNYAAQYALPGVYAPTASYELLEQAVDNAKKLGISAKVGNILTSDTFYDDSSSLAAWQKMGVLAVEMEAAALYMNAARAGKDALCICTISDCPFTGESASPDERQTGFNAMMELALHIA